MKIEKLTAMALERVDFDRYLLAAAVGKRAEEIANGAAPVVNMDPKIEKFTDIALVEIAEGKLFYFWIHIYNRCCSIGNGFCSFTNCCC